MFDNNSYIVTIQHIFNTREEIGKKNVVKILIVCKLSFYLIFDSVNIWTKKKARCSFISSCWTKMKNQSLKQMITFFFFIWPSVIRQNATSWMASEIPIFQVETSYLCLSIFSVQCNEHMLQVFIYAYEHANTIELYWICGYFLVVVVVFVIVLFCTVSTLYNTWKFGHLYAICISINMMEKLAIIVFILRCLKNLKYYSQ